MVAAVASGGTLGIKRGPVISISTRMRLSYSRTVYITLGRWYPQLIGNARPIVATPHATPFVHEGEEGLCDGGSMPACTSWVDSHEVDTPSVWARDVFLSESDGQSWSPQS